MVTVNKKVATEARCMKELSVELDGKVGLVGTLARHLGSAH